MADYANIGYNATKAQYFYGCKCHALVSESGYLLDYVISEANTADSEMTKLLLGSISTKTVHGVSLLEFIHKKLSKNYQICQGRKGPTSFLIADAQSVANSSYTKDKRYDAGKEGFCIKRHLMMDINCII